MHFCDCRKCREMPCKNVFVVFVEHRLIRVALVQVDMPSLRLIHEYSLGTGFEIRSESGRELLCTEKVGAMMGDSTV